MSIDNELGYADKKRKYDREYHREYRKIGGDVFRIKSADNIRLKELYNEYVTTCQQNLYLPVQFHDFVLQFCEIGFFSWRDRNKGK